MVIDRNPTRGSQLVGLLISLGYDSELEQTGSNGFLAAAETTDVELILISYDLFGSGWSLNDTLANLGADSRTATIPIFIYGPLNVQYKRPNLEHDYPGISYLVQPVDPSTLKAQLKGLSAPLDRAERATNAQQAVKLLAQIAAQKDSPLTADLPTAKAALAVALEDAQKAIPAANALGRVPDPDAQCSLLALVLDPFQALAIRKQGTVDLIHSIQQFGPLVTTEQERRLITSLLEVTDTDVRADLTRIVRALHRPRSTNILRSPKALKLPSASIPVDSPKTPLPAFE